MCPGDGAGLRALVLFHKRTHHTAMDGRQGRVANELFILRQDEQNFVAVDFRFDTEIGGVGHFFVGCPRWARAVLGPTGSLLPGPRLIRVQQPGEVQVLHQHPTASGLRDGLVPGLTVGEAPDKQHPAGYLVNLRYGENIFPRRRRSQVINTQVQGRGHGGANPITTNARDTKRLIQ